MEEYAFILIYARQMRVVLESENSNLQKIFSKIADEQNMNLYTNTRPTHKVRIYRNCYRYFRKISSILTKKLKKITKKKYLHEKLAAF